MSDLLNEIMEEILVRLPAESLVRCNLVCKQWRSLISDPHFVKKHLNHVLLDRSTNRHHKLIVSYGSNFYSMDMESLNSTKRDSPFQSPGWLHILGCCNGLLFIAFHQRYLIYKTLLLWNPLLSDYNKLPECSSDLTSVALFGFGYDSSIDDYKVVRVSTNSELFMPIRYREHRVEIYTLKTNSWKTIRGIPYGNVSFCRYPVDGGTLVNGSIYWLVNDYNYDDDEKFNKLIIGFDLINEKFRLVRVPNWYDDYKQTMWGCSLVEVRGCLGLYYTQCDFRGIQMWILKEDGNKNEHWSKLMRIPMPFRMNCLAAFRMKNDEVLLSVTSHEESCKEEKKKLVVYDLENSTFRSLRFCGISKWWNEMIYVGTLVSPNGLGG